MSESDTPADGTDRPTPGGIEVEAFEQDGHVAAIADVDGRTIVFGYADGIAERLRAGDLDPDDYVAVNPDERLEYEDPSANPAFRDPDALSPYEDAMRRSGARVHTDVNERGGSDKLYADGIGLDEGVGLIPGNPSDTVVLRYLRDGGSADLLVSNAEATDPAIDERSLSGAMQLYGDDREDPLIEEMPDGPSVELLGDGAAERGADLTANAEASEARVTAERLRDGVDRELRIDIDEGVTADDRHPTGTDPVDRDTIDRIEDQLDDADDVDRDRDQDGGRGL